MFCVVRIVGQFCPELSRHCLVSDFGRELLRIAEVDRVLFVFGIYLRFFNINHVQLSPIHFNRLAAASSSRGHRKHG